MTESDKVAWQDMSRRNRWFEIGAAVLLSVAVVGSAYSAWQATRWSGVQATAFAEASSARIESAKAQSRGVQQSAYDASTFLQLMLAYSQGTTEAALDLRERFVRDEFSVYLEQWLDLEPFQNPDAPRNPFELESFGNAELERARALEGEASLKFEEATAANQTGDDYILATVYFAMVLFFAGVATKFDSAAINSILEVLAVAVLALALWQVYTLPFY